LSGAWDREVKGLMGSEVAVTIKSDRRKSRPKCRRADKAPEALCRSNETPEEKTHGAHEPLQMSSSKIVLKMFHLSDGQLSRKQTPVVIRKAHCSELFFATVNTTPEMYIANAP